MNFRSFLEASYFQGKKYGFDETIPALQDIASKHPDAFVRYSDYNQLTFNKKSSYDTPIGVYAYPIKYVLERLTGIHKKVPFAGDKIYLIVFEATGNIINLKKKSKNVSLDISPYSILVDSLEDAFSSDLDNEFVGDIIDYVKRTYESDIASSKNAAKSFDDFKEKIFKKVDSKENWSEFSSLLKYAFDDFEDKLKESRQIPQIYDEKLEELAKKLNRDYDHDYNLLYDDILLNWRSEASLLWLMTRLWANNNITTWTKLLLNLGIDGIIDNGTGTIHPNEPIQGVFFNISKLKYITTINNMPDVDPTEYLGKRYQQGPIQNRAQRGTPENKKILNLARNIQQRIDKIGYILFNSIGFPAIEISNYIKKIIENIKVLKNSKTKNKEVLFFISNMRSKCIETIRETIRDYPDSKNYLTDLKNEIESLSSLEEPIKQKFNYNNEPTPF